MSPQLSVSDLARALAFYTEKLEFELEFLYEDFYAGIMKDGYSIHLKTVEQPAEPKKYQGDHGPIELLLSVERIKELYELLAARSVLVVQPLRRMPYGLEFYIADPDSNILAFVESVPAG